MKLLVLCLCLFLFVLPQTFSQEVTINIATIVPEGSTWVKCLNEIDKECREQIGVRLVIYAGGVAGEYRAVLQKIQYNQLDGAGFTGAGLAEVCPKVRVMEMPHMFQSLDEWRYIFKKIRPEVTEDFKKADFLVLGWICGGFIHIYSKSPIRSLEDFRASKAWIYPEDNLMQDYFREISLSGVPLGIAGVVTALQTGLVNCVYNTPYGLIALQWHTNVTHCTDTPIAVPLGGLIITKKAFERIPAQNRDRFLRICNKHFTELNKRAPKDNEDAMQDLKTKYKIQIVKITPEWEKESLILGRKIAEKQVGKMYSKEFLKSILDYLEKFRKGERD